MASDVTLTCPNVNSGTAVSFQGATISYAWKNLTRTTPLTNQFTLGETQMAGYENPKIVVKGYIDTNQSTSNVVTQSLLLDFAKIPYDATASNSITFSVSTGSTSAYLRNAANTANSLKVVIENFNIDIDAGDAELGHLWNYTMTLVETA